MYVIKALLSFQSRWAYSTEILAKGQQNYIPLSANSSSLPAKKMLLGFCLHKVRFPWLNHDNLSGYRGQGEITRVDSTEVRRLARSIAI